MFMIKILKKCFGQSVSESVIKTFEIKGSFDGTYWYYMSGLVRFHEVNVEGYFYTRFENGCTMDCIYM